MRSCYALTLALNGGCATVLQAPLPSAAVCPGRAPHDGGTTMKRPIAFISFLVAVIAAPVVWAQTLAPAKPEEVGLSAQRLEKIGEVFKRDIEQGKLPGVVVMIARKGRLAYAGCSGS